MDSDLRSLGIEIHYVSQRRMDMLRKKFQLDHDPSVLSFCFNEEKEEFPSPDTHTHPLGEIVLCPYYIEREAKEFGMSAADHEGRLIAHGVLHLLGYDHEDDASHRHMFDIERSVLEDFDTDLPE